MCCARLRLLLRVEVMKPCVVLDLDLALLPAGSFIPCPFIAKRYANFQAHTWRWMLRYWLCLV